MGDHKKWVSEIFDKAAPGYGKKSSAFFSYFGKRLVEQVQIPSNAQILDVATGRGADLFPVAEALGFSGKVVGIDISTQMLKETSQEVLERNINSITLLHMDAEQLNFSNDSFDFVFCGFALFFFPSITTALAEFKRVLKPGGTLVVSTWGDDSELDSWVNEEIRKLSNTKSLAVTPLWTEAGLYQILADASFKKIQVIEETKIFLHATPEDWWNSLWNHGTRAKFEQLSSMQIENLHMKAIKKAMSLHKGEGIIEPLQVFYGIAHKS